MYFDGNEIDSMRKGIAICHSLEFGSVGHQIWVWLFDENLNIVDDSFILTKLLLTF